VTCSEWSLPDWLAHLEALHPKGQAGIELGLDRVRAVKAALGQHEFCPVIIVGGTNGKGSTCAYLETILDRAAFKVGCYSSPHLIRYNERVRINGRPVDDDELCRAFAKVEAARGDLHLTYFEFGTLAAWEVFAAAGIDVAILEVGLGGRLDAVNVYEPDVAVVTGIALDHMDYLGPTRETIGFEKAGIFRPGKPALCADRQPPASLLEHAQAIGAELMLLGRDFAAERIPDDRTQWRYWRRRGCAEKETIHRNLAFPGLRGEVQIYNAAAAITALDCLRDRLPVGMQAVRRGLVETELAGRFQVLPGRPAVILDVAHNPQACAVLADNLGGMGFFEKTVAIVGMLADKDIEGALRPLAGKVDQWLTIPLSSPRSASPEQLAAAIAKIAPQASVECCDSGAEAVRRAAMSVGEADRIVVFGSFLTVGAIAGDANALATLREARQSKAVAPIRQLK
jgi:dihydrofolate synthase / folylpolyglutamate synthase